MLSLKPANLLRHLDFSDVERIKAFLGFITTKVREKAIAQIPDESGILIDIATGNGLFLIDIELRYKHSYKLIGLDLRFNSLIDAQKISETNNVPPLEWVNGDAIYLPFKDESISMVFCLNTFLNIKDFDDVKSILSELIRITKPGGKIVFDIRNKSNFFISTKYFFHSLKNTFATSSYTVQQFKNIQSDLDIKIENIDVVGPNVKLFAFDYIITMRKNKVGETI